MKIHQFQLLEQLDPSTNRAYRIIEVVITSEGPRSRIIGGAFMYRHQAEKEIERLRYQLEQNCKDSQL